MHLDYIYLVRYRWLSGQLFGKSFLLGSCTISIYIVDRFPFRFGGQDFGSDCFSSWSFLIFYLMFSQRQNCAMRHFSATVLKTFFLIPAGST